MLLSATLLIAVGATVIAAHPVYHHKFKAIVNSDPCLKKCMDNATEDDRELNLLKTANVTGFLLNLEEHCSVISSARECIAACKIDSAHNPFTLESMTSVCSEETLTDVRQMEPCLRRVGSEAENGVADTCKEKCGDYDEVNDHVHRLSNAYTPETHDQHKEREVMGRLGEACKILKCSDRCTVDLLSDKCPNLADGRDAGDALATIIERVLQSQRKDLERLGLVDTMAHSLPTQCSFMYVPELMLNETKDAEAMQEITMSMATVHADHALHRHHRAKHEHLNLALSQLHTRQLQKQIEVLDLQAENLKKESEKLDMEIELLEKKTEEQAPKTKTGEQEATTESSRD
jgi:hypothetical protein